MIVWGCFHRQSANGAATRQEGRRRLTRPTINGALCLRMRPPVPVCPPGVPACGSAWGDIGDRSIWAPPGATEPEAVRRLHYGRRKGICEASRVAGLQRRGCRYPACLRSIRRIPLRCTFKPLTTGAQGREGGRARRPVSGNSRRPTPRSSPPRQISSAGD